MRAPLFWSRPAGLAARLLWPLAQIWIFFTRRRLANGPWVHAQVPVICVGNINAGGTGKTPGVIALIAILSKMGHKPHVISRGYGGTETGPLKVNECEHNAAMVGDEPLEIAAFGPCWIARDRVAGTKAAVAAGADVIILDDGFQNPALIKDLSIVVIDAEVGFGNGCVLPAGPLREPLSDGLARADVILTLGKTNAQENLARRWPEITAVTRWKAELQPLDTGMDWPQSRVLAFAGIGRPGKFFATLSALGANVVATRDFPDHAPYTDTILRRLKAEADTKSAQLVTTEKDMARLPKHFRPEVLALPVRLKFADQDAIIERLKGLWGP